MPGRESIPKVMGRRMAMAKITFNPGIAPMTVPAARPMFIIRMLGRVNIAFNTSKLTCSPPYLNMMWSTYLNTTNMMDAKA